VGSTEKLLKKTPGCGNFAITSPAFTIAAERTETNRLFIFRNESGTEQEALKHKAEPERVCEPAVLGETISLSPRLRKNWKKLCLLARQH